jgi:hypothetical protein
MYTLVGELRLYRNGVKLSRWLLSSQVTRVFQSLLFICFPIEQACMRLPRLPMMHTVTSGAPPPQQKVARLPQVAGHRIIPYRQRLEKPTNK